MFQPIRVERFDRPHGSGTEGRNNQKCQDGDRKRAEIRRKPLEHGAKSK